MIDDPVGRLEVLMLLIQVSDAIRVNPVCETAHPLICKWLIARDDDDLYQTIHPRCLSSVKIHFCEAPVDAVEHTSFVRSVHC